MADDFVDLNRYVLEQEFISDKNGEIETCRTAIVSIIGDEPLDDFERRLADLNYTVDRFGYFAAFSRAGRWNMKGTGKIPDFATGLIFITTQSELALEKLESEAQKYWDAGITPFIAWPGRTHFAMRMKQQLAQYNEECHFVSLKSGCTDQSSPVSVYSKEIVAYVEALLVPGSYPGLVGLDEADVRCVFADCSYARIHSFEADSFAKLRVIARSGLVTKNKMLGVLAALIGPSSLRLVYVHEVMSLVREKFPHDASTVIFAALSDSARQRYTLYVTFCE